MKLEKRIYAKGLENAYGSVVLGEQEQALAYIEALVYLTRAFADADIQQPVISEVALLEHIRAVCWPNMQLSIHVKNRALTSCRVNRGCLADAVCRTLFDSDRVNICSMTLLVAQAERGGIEYRLLEEGREISKGVISDE